jgi:AcrR family transcriptional regulator
MAKATTPPRRSIRAAQKELTRDTLLDAARGAFEADGYVNVTIDDIVQGAGAARGTFYLYFDSKAAIFQAVLEKLQLRDQYRQLLVRLNALENPTINALQAWFEQYADLYSKNRAFHRAIHEAQAAEPAVTDALLRDLDQDIRLWRLPGFAPDADNQKLQLTALMGYLMAEGAMYLWAVHGLNFDRTNITRVLAEQFHAALHLD